MVNSLTTEEWLHKLGQDVKALRLEQNLGQDAVAERAGISRAALRNLESGSGASLSTLVRVLRALGREAWLGSLAPVVTINPLHMVRAGGQRQRATRRKKD